MIRFIIKHKTLGFGKGRGSFSIPIGAKKTEIKTTSSFKEWNKRFARNSEKQWSCVQGKFGRWYEGITNPIISKK